MPQNAFYLAAAAVAAIVLSAMLATGTLNIFGAGAPAVDRVEINPAVMEAAREWERQRLAQSGYADPVLDPAREWERQRRQQSGASE